MIKIINERKNMKTSLFHYAHFICDCLYPEVINEIYKYEKVIRLKNIRQTLGNFVKIYEDVMKNKSVELPEYEFHSLNIRPTILLPKSEYHSIQYMNKFRDYIFNRYNINPLVYLENYPEILLVKRDSRRQLIDDPRLQTINTNISTGSERREIKDIGQVEDCLKQYGEKFRAVYLEDICFEEQVKLFNNAKIIVLAHGAALSNMFFSKESTTILEVRCDKDWHFFTVISKTLKLNHIRVITNEASNVIKQFNKVWLKQ
jgi:hypothetical protein